MLTKEHFALFGTCKQYGMKLSNVKLYGILKYFSKYFDKIILEHVYDWGDNDCEHCISEKMIILFYRNSIINTNSEANISDVSRGWKGEWKEGAGMKR